MAEPALRERTPTASTLHFGFVDGMRGFSSLFVVFHHVWQFAISSGSTAAPRWFRILSFLKFGDFAVVAFVAISGFCLMLPVISAPDENLSVDIRRFLRERSRRILPPYYAALAASVLVISLAPSLRRPSGLPWDITLPHFTIGNFVSHALGIHNWSLDWRWGLNPPLWTVALEFQIYLVFAFVLVPIWRVAGIWATIAIAFAIGVAPLAIGAGFADPWMLGVFALGMAAALIGTADESTFVWRHRFVSMLPIVVSLSAIVAIVVVSEAVESETTRTLVRHVAVAIAMTQALTAMAIRVCDGSRPSAPERLLSSLPVRRLGWFSYSLYLVHYPIVALITLVLVRNLGQTVPVNFALLTLTAVPASIGIAFAFHVAIERRFLNRPFEASPERLSAPD